MSPPRLSIALISAAALGYEVLLMRLFSIIQWHHFAYMLISLALLGYGASGSFLTLARHHLLPHFTTVYFINIFLFSLSSVACFIIAQHLPFNPLEAFWDPLQSIWLFTIYLLLSLPFFFAANCVGLSLSHYSTKASHIYAADLLGAGAGSIVIILLLFTVFPEQVLLLFGSLIAISAGLACYELKLHSKWIAGLVVVFVVLPWTVPQEWSKPVISPFKGLNQLLQINGTRIISEQSSPLGLVSVVESLQTPIRHAPGLSVVATQWPVEQKAIFIDGGGMSALTHYDGDRSKLAYLDQMTSALPYHLGRHDHVLILGAGGGSDILQAHYHNADRIDAVELNPHIAELVQQEYKDIPALFSQSGTTTMHVAEARGYISGSDAHYDLIQISLLDSFSASSAGLYALSESYLYTVEAFQDYLQHLNPGGYLAISRWIRNPPRDTLKLFATAIQAQVRLQVEHPALQLALIRGWQTSTLIVKNGMFNDTELNKMRRFCETRAFDIAYAPGTGKVENNRYNRLKQDHFFHAAQAFIGGKGDSFTSDYKFKLNPATDDRPYFFNFFKWRTLAEIVNLRGKGGTPMLESGYLILIVSLTQAILASFILILLPLIVGRRTARPSQLTAARIKGLIYFFMLGLAFLFIEIAFIQKFILFLHHPLYAVSVVLAAFLIFAGLGSAFSNRFAEFTKTARTIRIAVFCITALCLGYLFLVEPLFNELLAYPVTVKIAVTVILIAPLAFSMGMPFPLGLARLNETAPVEIPWVWGINGCASVISAILATITAIHLGFSAVIIFALLFYITAAATLP